MLSAAQLATSARTPHRTRAKAGGALPGPRSRSAPSVCALSSWVATCIGVELATKNSDWTRLCARPQSWHKLPESCIHRVCQHGALTKIAAAQLASYRRQIQWPTGSRRTQCRTCQQHRRAQSFVIDMLPTSGQSTGKTIPTLPFRYQFSEEAQTHECGL